MATINLYLSSAKKDRVNIRVRVRDGRNVSLYYTSDILINPTYWDEKQQNIRPRISINTAERIELTRKIQNLKLICEKAYEDLKHSSLSISSENFVRLVEQQIYPERQEKSKAPNFFSVWDEFLYSKQNMMGGKKTLIICRDDLIRFERYYQTFKDKNFSLSFASVSETIIQQFYDFLIKECHYIDHPAMKEFYKNRDKRLWKEERHINTANARVKKVRTFWNWAIKRGYTKEDPFKTYTIPSDRYATPIFLLTEEVKRIYNLDLSNDAYLDKARDLFIFQCMIGCRREDLWSLTKDNIQEGVLSYIPKKTIQKQQKTLRIPLNSIALEILHKYKTEKYLLPTFISINFYNRAIKKIASIAMLDRKVTIFNTKGNPEIKELCEVISSHIARKTFISTLINNGVAPQVISSMSGHVPNSKAFERYFNIEDDIKKSVVKNLEI